MSLAERGRRVRARPRDLVLGRELPQAPRGQAEIVSTLSRRVVICV